MEKYFRKFKENIIGEGASFDSPYGTKKIVYADWTASGRLYAPIEALISDEIGKYLGNTHTETSITGSLMTHLYHSSLEMIKKHVNANNEDAIISQYSGMTGVINKFQRILGLRLHEDYHKKIIIDGADKPVIFISHMEHHSNQTSWLETIADVEIIAPGSDGLPDLNSLDVLLEKYDERKLKIAAVTSCSNVTGIFTPYYEIAEKMHNRGGLCFVDFAASAPYINIDMHPANPVQSLDAIYFSPHKFLGGPGSTGILIFNKKLYKNRIPDQPGGGTVKWTNPWGEHEYLDDIESREDGGTPAFLQTSKVALAIRLKEEMGVDNMLIREKEILKILWNRLEQIPNLHILAYNQPERLGIISFYIDELHYNLAVRLLNDRFGIQVRGGCSCAGTYGHYLLNVDIHHSRYITGKINTGDLSSKPGWIRLSIHPVITDDEAVFIADAVEELSKHHVEWSGDYIYDNMTNEFFHKNDTDFIRTKLRQWIG